MRPYVVTARRVAYLLAGASLTQSRGLPSAVLCSALPTGVKEAPVSCERTSVGLMCTRVRLSRRRSMGEARTCFGRG